MDLDLNKYIELVGRKCDYCGEDLYKSKQGFGMFAEVCLNPDCPKYYRSPDGSQHSLYHKMRPDAAQTPKKRQDWGATARKQDAYGYLAKYSLYADDRLIRKDFANFDRDTTEQGNAYNLAVTIAGVAAKKPPVHAYLFGKPGAGKSHLANGIIIAAMKASDYRLRALFWDWREYVDLSKHAMNNKAVANRFAEIQMQLDRAGLIVLDDLGSERMTEYTINLADAIARKRENKSLIITSNLAAPALRDKYGERMFSRLMAHSNGFSFHFANASDYRQQVI